MHPTTQESKATTGKLSELADDINNEFRQSNAFAVEAIKGGASAIKAAIRAGGLLRRAKTIVGHGGWENWLLNNCPDIGKVTAQRWMALSKASQVKDLKDARNLTDAYRKVGLIPESAPKTTPIGTAPVNIFERLFSRLDKGLTPIIDIAGTVEPQDMPEDVRHRLLDRVKPVVELADKLKALEGA